MPLVIEVVIDLAVITDELLEDCKQITANQQRQFHEMQHHTKTTYPW